MSRVHERHVRRVLVVLDYGDGDPKSGEVLDLTALTQELDCKVGQYTTDLHLKVSFATNYNKKPCVRDARISWSAYAGGQLTSSSGYLEDVLNAVMADSDKVKSLLKKQRRLQRQAQEVEFAIKEAKMEAASAIRGQYPIAKMDCKAFRALDEGGAA